MLYKWNYNWTLNFLHLPHKDVIVNRDKAQLVSGVKLLSLIPFSTISFIMKYALQSRPSLWFMIFFALTSLSSGKRFLDFFYVTDVELLVIEKSVWFLSDFKPPALISRSIEDIGTSAFMMLDGKITKIWIIDILTS